MMDIISNIIFITIILIKKNEYLYFLVTFSPSARFKVNNVNKLL